MAQRDAESLASPNWDEFDPAEELDYTEDPHGEDYTESIRSGPDQRATESASPALVEEPHTSSQMNAQVTNDRLPQVQPYLPQTNSRTAIGPALPPWLHIADDSAPEDPSNDPEDPELETTSMQVIGPALPQFVSTPGPSAHRNDVPVAPFTRSSVAIGPAMPSHLSEVGPSLPEDELKNFNNGLISTNCPPPEPGETRASMEVEDARSIGPALPPDLLPVTSNRDDEEQEFGPMPPPPTSHSDPDMPFDVDDDEDEPIGPMPCTDTTDQAATEYAIRRIELEHKQASSSNKTKREEWMTSLPTKLTNYGLGARTFSKSASTAERDSSWTEGPNGNQGASTSTAGTSHQNMADRMRDEEQERIANELNSNKDSLMDSHNRKRKADTKTDAGSSSQRKPFDREKDMEVRGLKNATPAEIQERCGQLTSRFGSGNSQRFL